jgi:exo-1,4-beta-D-glucosaminidase
LLSRLFAQPAGQSFALMLKDDWKMQSAVTDPATADKYISPVNLILVMPGTSGKRTHYYYWRPAGQSKFMILTLFWGKTLKRLNDPKLDKPWWFRREFTLPAYRERQTGDPGIAWH